MLVVRPESIDAVLNNPGMGITTFQNFNGDKPDPGLTWSEGYSGSAIENEKVKDHLDDPLSSVAYIRLYWNVMEPAPGSYRWDLIDEALSKARQHGQTLMIRLMPFGAPRESNSDVPGWYRTLAHDFPDAKFKNPQWRVNPENAAYLKYFGSLIEKFGERYDGNEELESVDISIVGPWGEGSGTELLSEQTRQKLLDIYFHNFKKTTLLIQPWDWLGSRVSLETDSSPKVGVRFDCLGDLGGFSKTWSHMNDLYPQILIHSGLQDAWKKRPVSMEACWVMNQWKKNKWDIDYIINQSLKWHISSFNNKSSAIPKDWRHKVDRWLKKMGYRIVLRKFSCNNKLLPGGVLNYAFWWENQGVAPPYHRFSLALRLRGRGITRVFLTSTDITRWLPGDSLSEGSFALPSDLPKGEYSLSVGIIDPVDLEPRIQLAIQNRAADGWYPMGTVSIVSNKNQ
jgi:hypothetical protein